MWKKIKKRKGKTFLKLKKKRMNAPREIRQDISTYIHKQVQGKVKELFTELKKRHTKKKSGKCEEKSTKINFSAYLAFHVGFFLYF